MSPPHEKRRPRQGAADVLAGSGDGTRVAPARAGRPALPPSLQAKLRTRRAEVGMSRRELGAEAGVSRGHVHGIEVGRWRPSLGVAVRLALALRLDLASAMDLALAAGPPRRRPGRATPRTTPAAAA